MHTRFYFAMFLIILSFIINGCFNCPDTYPHTAEVVSLDYVRNRVKVRTYAGLFYEFNGIEDYMVGDLVSMIMNSNGTKDNVLDDEIIEVRYAGYRRVTNGNSI